MLHLSFAFTEMVVKGYNRMYILLKFFRNISQAVGYTGVVTVFNHSV